jgi:hypothetical protein
MTAQNTITLTAGEVMPVTVIAGLRDLSGQPANRPTACPEDDIILTIDRVLPCLLE